MSIASDHTLLALMAALSLLSSNAAAEPSPLLITGSSQPDHRQDASEPSGSPRPDALFPGRWRVGVSLASGVPFAAVGELVVGTVDDFALGFIAGVATTGDESAVGGRARIRVVDAGDVDVALVLPVLFYPPVEKRNDAFWVLTSPSLLLRGRPSEDWLVYGGAGAVLAACVDDIGTVFSGDEHHALATEQMVNGAWHTFNAGASLRVHDGVALFVDSMVMMTNFVPSESYSDKIGPPFLAELGANYTF
jgi:hypothetical protein